MFPIPEEGSSQLKGVQEQDNQNEEQEVSDWYPGHNTWVMPGRAGVLIYPNSESQKISLLALPSPQDPLPG